MRRLFFIGLIMFVVCFLLGTITWFTIDQHKPYQKEVHKRYNAESFDEITVHTSTSDIEIVQSDHFEIKYVGRKGINIIEQNNKLKISEQSAKEKILVNLIPYLHYEEKLKVYVPKKRLKDVSTESNTGKIRIKGIQTDALGVINSTGNNCIYESRIGELDIKAENSYVEMHDTTVDDAVIRVLISSIGVTDSTLKNALVTLEDGGIYFKGMGPSSSIKASTHYGDIVMSYAKPPTNTLLKLNAGKGEKHIDNPVFKKRNRVGDGENVLEFYTTEGDISIE